MTGNTQPVSWSLTDSDKAGRLERAFRNRAIDFRSPGFCDLPSFLKAEAEDPRFLEAYAEYVESRPYEPEYLEDARRKVCVVADAVRTAVAADGRLGACVDVSGMVGRMLDRLGIWNYIAKTCLTIDYPARANLPATYYYGLDTNTFVAPHAVVVAPPFFIIDVSAKYQPFQNPNQAGFIPDEVLADRFEKASWTYQDIVSPEVAIRFPTSARLDAHMRRYHKCILEVAEKLPARRVRPDAEARATLKYVIVAVGGFVEQLEGVVGYKPCGRTALQIFNEDVVPKL